MKDALWFIVIVIVLSVLTQFLTGKSIFASDWSLYSPQVLSRSVVPNAAPQDMFACGEQEMTINVSGVGTIHRACVFGATSAIRVARSGHFYAVAFPSNDQFYELRGVCASPKCAYSSVTDALIMHSHLGSYRLGIELYKDFSRQLKRRTDTSLMRTYFQFDPVNPPDFSLKIGDISLQGESVAFSANGKYAIIEARTYGFFRLDIDTLEVRRVIAPGSTYGLLNDPYYELAISNNGDKVALAGYRGQTSVHLVDSSCGDYPVPDLPRSFPEGVRMCDMFYLEEASNTPGFYYSFQPRFNNDGSRLGVSVYNRDVTVERLIYGLKTNTNPVGYIALGDSFTSGEGEESDVYYKEFKFTGSKKCHVSVRSYPYLVAKEWGIETQNVACSGARTFDIVNSVDYDGQSAYVKGLSDAQKAQVREFSLGYFQAGILPQLNFVSEYQPSIVSIGIGGNDAGLMGKLAACLNIDTCEWAKEPDKRFMTAREVSAVYPKIREVIANVKQVSPSTKIVVIGYPKIISTSTEAACGLIIGSLLNNEERLFIDESIKLLNDVAKSAAYAERVGYIDVAEALNGNRLCESSNTPAMNGVRIGDDIAPVSFLKNFRIIGSESFHPTYRGHELIAQRIMQFAPAINLTDSCGECSPDVPPDLDGYWKGTEDIENHVTATRHQAYRQFTHKIEYTSGESIEIKTQNDLFDANTEVKIELHSEPVVLGRVWATASGAIDISVALPETVPPGYHTVHLLGKSRGNDDLDVYYTIAIVDKNATADNKVVDDPLFNLDTTSGVYTYQSNTKGLPAVGVSVSSDPSIIPDTTSELPKESLNHSTRRGWYIQIIIGCVLGLIALFAWWLHVKRKQFSQDPGG